MVLPDEKQVKAYSEIIKSLGVPVVLVFVLLGIIVFYVLAPLTDRQMKFMDSIEATNRQHAETASKQAETIRVIGQTLDSIKATEEAQEKILEKLTDHSGR